MLTRETMTSRQRAEWPHLRNLYLTATHKELTDAMEVEITASLACDAIGKKAYHIGRASMFMLLIAEATCE